MSSLSFNTYLDKTSEVVNRVVEAWVDASASNGARNNIYSKTLLTGQIMTDPTLCTPFTGMGAVTGVKEVIINQQNNVLSQFEWTFTFNGDGGAEQGTLVVNFPFSGYVYTNSAGKLVWVDSSYASGTSTVDVSYITPFVQDTSGDEVFSIVSPTYGSSYANPSENTPGLPTSNPYTYGNCQSNCSNLYGVYTGIVDGTKSTGAYLGAKGYVYKYKFASGTTFANLRVYNFNLELLPLPIPPLPVIGCTHL
jgi:hypothetical protein